MIRHRWATSKRNTSRFARHRQFIAQLRFIDMSGREVVRVDRQGDTVALVPPEQLQNRADEPYTKETLKLDRGQTYVSELELNAEQGTIEQPIKPTLRVGVPVFDGNGAKRGIIIINYLGQRILDRVSELRDAVADLWVVNAQGYWLLGPKDDVFAFMYPDRKDRTFAAAYPDVWRQMQTAPAGKVESDPGRFTFARADVDPSDAGGGPSPPSLFVLVTTPRAFSDAQTSALKFNFAVAACGLLALLGGISLGLARHQIHRHEAEQLVRLSEARLRAVTETASDAIISADRHGNIRYFNPGAEKTFGHLEQDVIGQPLTALMPERFRQAHTEGLQRYLDSREARVIGRTVELIGLRKDGREFPIELGLASSEVDGDLFFTAIVRDITDARRGRARDPGAQSPAPARQCRAGGRQQGAGGVQLLGLARPARTAARHRRLQPGAGRGLPATLLKPEHHSHLNRVRQAAQRMGRADRRPDQARARDAHRL